MVGTSSACQWAEGRGNFVRPHAQRQWQHLVQIGVVNDARTDPLIQTDFTVRHEIMVQDHESMRLAFEGNFHNLFNQRAVDVGTTSSPSRPTWSVRPVRPASRATRRWIGAR